MKKTLLKITLAFCCCVMTVSSIHSQERLIAFPGAEGFGKYATGGRNGTVYRVTNLNDSGTGSLRDAVSQPNRIVVFDVAGVIRINSRIAVKNNIYIAGQTAPGEGITVYGDGFSFSGASNTICRYLRIRMGKVGSKDKDALGIASGSNMIFDHVSVAWGLDENFSITETASDITIQNSIIGQGLLAHSAGGLIQAAGGVTIYRSLYIHNDTRNPKFKGTHQFVNNLVYNWKSAAYIMGGDSNSRSYGNAVGNYFITGTAGSTTAFSGGNDKYSIYAKDNWVDKNKNGEMDGYEIPQNEYSGGPTFVAKPFNYPELPTIAGKDVYDEIINTVGASLPYRDNLDWNFIRDVASFGEEGRIISDEKELLIGAPDTWNVWKGTKKVDTDGDGIPDEWETANGLNPNDPSDAMKIVNGYANIEHYINSITADNSQYFLKAPLSLRAVNTTQNEIQLEWLDYTDLEDGYIIEENINGTFQEIARVGKNVNTYKAVGLDAESTHIYRVKAYNDKTETDYTNELTVKTRPVPVSVIDPETFIPDAIWKGNISGDWNTTVENWNTGKFIAGNTVLFDDSTEGEKNVNLTEAIEQGTIVIKGDADYVFSGSAIGGSGSFNKTGKGSVKLGANNTYTGSTVIWDGVLEISKLANGGQPSSIGASANYDFNWVWNGGKISYTGNTVSTDRNVALENATEFEITNSAATVTINGTIAGTGDFIKSGPGRIYSTFGKHTYTGNTIIREGTYELNGRNESVGIQGKLILEGGRFKTSGGKDGMDGIYNFPIEVNGEKTSYFEPTNNGQINSSFSGSGNLQIDLRWVREFFKGSWENFYGNLTLNRIAETTEFMINNEGNSKGIPNAKVHVNANVSIKGGKNSSTYYFGALSGDVGSYLVCSHIKTAGGAVTWVIGGLNTDEEFRGVINGGVTHSSRKGQTNIVKEGTGYWRLTNTNKYFGTTTVNGGMLIVNGLHTGDKDVNTYVAPKGYTVNDEGTLAGKGTIEATVNVKSGGTLSPGDFGIGTLTIKSATTLENGSILAVDIDRKKKTNDKLTVNGKLTLSGDLHINLEDGEFAVGDAMTILSATSYSGQFANILPATPGEGMEWDTSSLYTTGILKVSYSTGIDLSENPDLRIRSVNGMILVEGITSPETINIYDLSGTNVYNQWITSSSVEIPVNNGLYFVKIGNRTAKVIVR